MTAFHIDPHRATPFPHYWEMCVGSCHAYTALREDYRKQLTRAHRELGFRYVRFHGVLDDDMCVLVRNKDGELVYNFANIDNIFDFLLEIGMKPFVELGFMPKVIASGEKTVFHYLGNVTPPKDYQDWGSLIKKLVEHLIERYGLKEVQSWYFEVWNEPNLTAFWAGTKEDYFRLYEVSAKAVKAVDTELKVGGPATSCNMWIEDMIAFCQKRKVPLDFISTHHYPTDDPLWKSGMNLEDFRKAGFVTKVNERGILKKMVEKAKKEAVGMPLIYTEWNVSAVNGDHCHDTSYASAMIAKILADNDGYVDGYAFWTFSDIFEEGSQLPGVFCGGFGLMTYGGIAKPAYRVMELLHKMGETRLAVESIPKDSTVEMLAVRTETGFQFLVYNYDIAEQPPEIAEITIDISNLHTSQEAVLYRIDEGHANAYQVWREMGAPEYIKTEMVEGLHKASELQPEKVFCDQEIHITIPPYGVVLIELEEAG